MGLALKVVTAPTLEPVTLEEAKVHCKVEYDDEDAYIGVLIQSARAQAEEYLGRALFETEFDYQLDAFPVGVILLPRPPLLSVTSISYVDDAGATQVWSAGSRRVDSISEPARITPTYLGVYPTTQPVTGGVTVRFKAGFAATADGQEAGSAKIPAPIRHAILMAVHKAFAHRDPVVVGTIIAETDVIRNLLAPYRFLLPAAA